MELYIEDNERSGMSENQEIKIVSPGRSKVMTEFEDKEVRCEQNSKEVLRNRSKTFVKDFSKIVE